MHANGTEIYHTFDGTVPCVAFVLRIRLCLCLDGSHFLSVTSSKMFAANDYMNRCCEGFVESKKFEVCPLEFVVINSLPFYMVVQPGHVKTGYVGMEMFVHGNLKADTAWCSGDVGY